MAKLFHNMARSSEECFGSLEAADQKVFRGHENGTLWCNATWDSVLCWPAIPANSSYTMSCPPLKGLDTEKTITKRCHTSGRWAGRNDTDFSNPSGWTNFISCMILDHEAAERAQEIAQGLRKMEFVGLTLSLVSLITSIAILAFYRRLRVFRNQIHLQLMLAILLTVIIRLVVYVDVIFTAKLGSVQAGDTSYTINTTKIVCETFYFLLEYGKTVAFAWMFIEGFYLHNTIVVTVFQETPKLWKYLLIGWGLPLVHVTIWLLVLVVTRKEIERCLGLYYLNIEYWIMDAVRLAELVANTGFLLNIVRVLWYKVKDAHSANESHQLKKSVKAALMLIPLLGIPNIMQTIPFTPTRHNITWFGIYTYIASFFYMFQGTMVAVLFCFTNREVINVIKSHYQRYRLQHSSADVLRRGSRHGQYNTAYYRGSRASAVQRLSTPESERHTGKPRTPVLTNKTVPLIPPPSYEMALADTMQEQTRLIPPPVPPDHTVHLGNGTVVVNVEDNATKSAKCNGDTRAFHQTTQEHRPLFNGSAATNCDGKTSREELQQAYSTS